MVKFDVIYQGVNIATMTEGETAYGAILDGYIAIKDGIIAAVGSASDLAPEILNDEETEVFDVPEGLWALPGFIDCHTHLIYGGDRAHEFEMRLQGASYADIAKAGGGINATVKATRALSENELIHASHPRLKAMMDLGVTTVEVKSGYGLTVGDEMKMLHTAKALDRKAGVDIITTFLGAHALPPEYEGNSDGYIDQVCNEMIPKVAEENLADAVDVFCETIGFSPSQTQRVFDAAKDHDIPVKIHAEQLTNQGGAALAAQYGALSADHVEYITQNGVAAMAKAGMVAVLLPGAFYTLQEKQKPPIEAFRAAGVPIALATDCNPGSSPTTSLPLMLHMGCTLFGLTVEEALRGITVNAARALGLTDRGKIATGMRADIAFFPITRPAELAYHIGGIAPELVIKDGIWVDSEAPLAPSCDMRWPLSDSGDIHDLTLMQEDGADAGIFTIEVGPTGFPADSAEHFMMMRTKTELRELATGLTNLMESEQGCSLDIAAMQDEKFLQFHLSTTENNTIFIKTQARHQDGPIYDVFQGDLMPSDARAFIDALKLIST